MYQTNYGQQLVEQYAATAMYRAKLDQQFSLMLGPWASLAEASRVEEPLVSGDGAFRGGLLGSACSYHAFLFWPLFPEVPEATIQDLNRAARLYADYHFLVDRIIDHDMATAGQQAALLRASFLLQHSLGILYRYFPDTSSFWQAFNQHQGELIQAIAFEKTISEQRSARSYDWSAFEQIACGKAAMLKCTIAALATLTDAPLTMVEKLYKLFDELAISAQLHDDFHDWQQDLEQGKLTYLLHTFLDEVGLQDTASALMLGGKELKRRFFTSEALPNVLAEAQRRLDAARAAPEWKRCEHWCQYLETPSYYLKETREELQAMRARLKSLGKLPTTISPLQKAIRFLVSSHQSNGAWSDFNLKFTGKSTGWVTGYVASVLQCDHQAQESLDRAVAWLLEQRFPSGGWGYHMGFVTDADSTAACISFLTGRLPLADIRLAVEALLTFQNADGGFSTYTSDSAESLSLFAYLTRFTNGELSDFSGWCMSQNCVTAAAMMALCRAQAAHAQIDCRDAIASALRYLLSQQQENGSWQPYWWQGNIYATAFTLRALHMATKDSAARPEVTQAVERALSFLLAGQLPDGGWSVDGAGTACPFQTGLALAALEQFPGSVPPSAVRVAVQALLQSQQPNGCWRAAAPILRVPHPADTHPWDWSMRTDHLPGTTSRDQNNFFTTATVLYALEQAKSLEQA